MVDLNLFLYVCVCVKERQRLIERQRSSMKYPPHVHAVHQSLWLCVSLHVLVTSCEIQLRTSATRAAVCLAEIPSSSMLKQFLLSCDR